MRSGCRVIDVVRSVEWVLDGRATLNFVVILDEYRTRGKRKEPAEQKILLSHFPALASCAIVSSTNSRAQALNPETTPIRTQVTRSISNN